MRFEREQYVRKLIDSGHNHFINLLAELNLQGNNFCNSPIFPGLTGTCVCRLKHLCLSA